MQGRGERDARFPPLVGGQHPKRWVFGQPLGVVGVLVAGQPAVDRLAEEVRQRKLPIVSGTGISEVLFDQGAQTKTFVHLTREQEAGIRGDRGSAELDAKLGIEREANRARSCVTHWMMPSAPARRLRDRISCGYNAIMAWSVHLSNRKYEFRISGLTPPEIEQRCGVYKY